jgi:hypothetical protein
MKILIPGISAADLAVVEQFARKMRVEILSKKTTYSEYQHLVDCAIIFNNKQIAINSPIRIYISRDGKDYHINYYLNESTTGRHTSGSREESEAQG